MTIDPQFPDDSPVRWALRVQPVDVSPSFGSSHSNLFSTPLVPNRYRPLSFLPTRPILRTFR